jgi:hypothetical protein
MVSPRSDKHTLARTSRDMSGVTARDTHFADRIGTEVGQGVGGVGVAYQKAAYRCGIDGFATPFAGVMGQLIRAGSPL